jgi:putative MATE family efflux protein
MRNGKTFIKDFTQGSIVKHLLLFSWPLMLSNLLQVLYNMVDMAIVGQFVGSAGLAAVSGGGDIMNIGTVFCMGFSSAGQIMISQHIGSDNHEGVRKTIGTMFAFLMLISVIITVVGVLCSRFLLNSINIPPESFSGAYSYCTTCFYGMFFIFGYNITSAIFRGMGDSKHPFIFIAIAAVLNFVLDLLFVVGFRLGPGGAALATVMAQSLSFIVSLIYIYKRRSSFGFDFRLDSFSVDFPSLLKLLKLGIPMALQHGAVLFSKLFVISYINAYGLIMSAVNAIGNKIGFCASIVTQALGTAGTSMIGQNFGAGKQDRIKRIVYTCIGCGLVFTITLSIFIIVFPEGVFGLFDHNPIVLRTARIYVTIAVLNFNAFALRTALMAFISGIGNGMLAFVIGIIDGIVGRICLAIIFGITFNMGIMGFWLGDVFSSYIPFVIGGIYFVLGNWKHRNYVVPHMFSSDNITE